MSIIRATSNVWVAAVILALSGRGVVAESKPAVVSESARQIPVVREVDVVVVGGSVAGVAAAVEAAQNGARVFLAAPRSYLGDDICATQRFWLEEGEQPRAALAKALFPAGSSPAAVPTPMHVKRTLDQALLTAKVDFLFNCLVTDVLRDAAGKPCGIVMANRSGRQAVVARTMIDATDRSTAARLAGAQFASYPAGPQAFERIVIGGQPRTGDGVSVRKLPFTRKSSDRKATKEASVYRYTIEIPMAGGSWSSFAAAEQIARDRTFHKDQLDASEVLFQVPPDPMKGAASVAGDWPGADAIALDAFRPAGVERFYVTGGCADVSRKAAQSLVRPLASIDVGARIGAAAAAEANRLPAVSGAHVPGKSISPVAAGDVKELLIGVRPTQVNLPTIPSEARGIPVWGTYDVVVVGGGTGGAASGIGAGRQRARTLVVEALHELGGVGTLGVITGYYSGYREGFTAEVTKGVQDMGLGKATSWSAIGKAEWWRTANRQAGVEIWCGATGVGAFVADGRVRGVVVATPLGRGVVLAKTVVDGTGSSDIAVAAGAAYHFVDGTEPAIQGAGLHTLRLGVRGPNTDFTFTDDTDMVDAWQLAVNARANGGDAYDMGQLLQTRERRRIVGEVTLTPMDLLLDRTWPDSIAIAKSHFDSHGFTVHPMFWARQPDIEAGRGEMFVPLRALQPKGLGGIFVASLGLSAHRDVMPILRMQANLQNLGYAAGVAAAMDAAGRLDIAALQRHLAEKGCIQETAVGAKDSFPFPGSQVKEAVVNVVKGSGMGLKPTTDFAGRPQVVDAKYNSHDIAVIFASPAAALPLLEQAYAAATSDQDRLLYAHLLGILGSPAGVETLLARVKAVDGFGEGGWNFVGMRQYGRNMNELDQFIIALGRTHDPRAVDVILEKVSRLDPAQEFSHHRACALALETLGDRRAAEPLAQVLSKPGMTGYAATTLADMNRLVENRSESLREMMLARALYRCGDHQGMGRKILESYAQDLRGPYARHARATLDEGGKK
jgi:flavin-dependent dehydrogenase